MKKIIIVLSFIFLCIPVFANETEAYSKIVLNNKEFICAGPFDCYDIKSYKYDISRGIHYVDYMYEYHPSIGMDIKCPLGKGFISNFIFSVKYIKNKNEVYSKYKGFVCAIDNFGIYAKENVKTNKSPITIYYNNKIRLLKPFINSEKELLPNFNIDNKEGLSKDLSFLNKYLKNQHIYKDLQQVQTYYFP